MALHPPLMDDRSFGDIQTELRDSAKLHIPSWQPGDEADPGVMLQHTFGRLMEIIIERLNRAPEKHLLAFLDSMGVSPLPPVPAQTALVFALKKNAPPVMAPRGTAVAATLKDGGPPPVFETIEDLTVLPAAITCAYTCEPGSDRYGDYTDCLNGAGFTPFSGDRLMADAYYFIDDTALSIEDPSEMHLILRFKQPAMGSALKIFLENLDWFYSEGDELRSFAPEYSLNNTTNYASLKLKVSPLIAPTAATHLAGGCEPAAGRFLKCTVRNNYQAKAAAAKVGIISADYEVMGKESTPQDIFFQNSRLDADNYFLPFGDRPQEGDAFYIGVDTFFSRPGATVYLNMRVSSGIVGRNRRWCELKWYYSAAGGWRSIAVNENDSRFSGDLLSLVFKCPSDAAPRKVGGVNTIWLRAVLPSGNYGCAAKYILKDNIYMLKDGTGEFFYPTVKSIRLQTKYAAMQDKLLATCRAYRQRGHVYTPLGEDDLPLDICYPEFRDCYFYLGFDSLIPHLPVSLYVDAEPAVVAGSLPAGSSPVWEILTTDGWQTVYVRDDTAGLARSGMARFSIPAEALCDTLFDNTARYWIRLSRGGNSRLKGIYLNAVTAQQTTTVPREALGFSNGSAHQRFNLRGLPVLMGQRVWVREAEAPTAAELSDTAVEERQNPVTLEREYWVLWQEQNGFGASQASSRHYTLYRESGELRFGDGALGMIPEKGAAIAVEYRYGGGERGNLPAGCITKPSVNLMNIAQVYNPLPATGGAGLEGLPSILDRGPMTLRHRGRGVTALDLQWLVKEAAGDALDRIKCLSGEDGQAFTLMLLPAVEGLRPLPDGALAAQVQEYLAERTPAAIGGHSFGIIGPRYITVGVSFTVIPANPLESNQVRERAIQRIHDFLHPRKGGTEGEGWPFGRNVYLSEICAVLEGVAGVDRALAATVSLYPAALQREVKLMESATRLEVNYPPNSLLSVCDEAGRITGQWLLAEAIVSQVLPNTIRVSGLREGDQLHITYPFVTNSANSSLIDFPAGSPVRLPDGSTSRLKENLPKGGQFTTKMLRDAPQIAAGDVITLIHPDTLQVEHLCDNADGGYTVSASCLCEEAPLAKGLVLECAKSKVKAELQDFEWEGDALKLRFCGLASVTGTFRLAPPHSPGGAVPLRIVAAQPILDTVYLSEHELTTPGEIQCVIHNS